jgi:hypothetical protein
MNRSHRSILLTAALLAGFAPAAFAVDIDLRTNTGFIVWGARSSDNAGRAVAFGDLDGDGFRDIIVGSIGVDGNGLTIPNSGAVDIVWGDTRVNLGASKDLLTQTDVRIEGADTGDQVGVFVVSGDFDGDGLDDLAMPPRSATAWATSARMPATSTSTTAAHAPRGPASTTSRSAT